MIRSTNQAIISMTLVASVALFAVPAAAAGNAENGATLSQHHCAKCHGKTGNGNGPALDLLNITPKPKDWTDKSQMSGLSDQDITNIITNGGASVGKSKKMPAYKGKLSDSDIADLTAYVRSLAK